MYEKDKKVNIKIIIKWQLKKFRIKSFKNINSVVEFENISLAMVID